MSQKNQGKPSVNDMVLMTEAENTEGIASWTSNDALHSAFKKNESLATEKSSLSKKGKTVNGGLTTQLTLAPLEEKTVTFQLVWYFKTVRHGSKNWTGKGNMYNNWWENALDVASYLRSKGEELEHKTRLFHDTLYASDMPRWFVDRLSSQLAVLRSQTCWWSADGYFGAWEGVSPARGCCNGNCTHVWHYAQGHARLFPELGRKMREQDFAQQKTNGLIPFRHYREDDAADGLFGTVLNAYREHQCSTDNTWLQKHWAQIKKTMDGGIAHWNPSQDGFLETVQHNTLDGAMTGCSSWIGTLYLSALEAAARMAEIVNDDASAKKYRKIRNSGKKLQNDKLWNGEYYIQKVGNQRIQDYLDGCHIDQILGEWWSDQLDMDRNYPKDRAKKAMQSLLKYNFFTNFHGKSLKPRQYSTIDDGGMKMITWPKGNQPIPGMKYGDEIMTGFEYAAAATMIQNDMLKEGLVVLKTVADRYNGVLRTDGVTKMDTGPWGYSGNPFGDDECGKYYGRSLSVWSVLFALQGFAYDGPKKYVKFKPVFKPENHTSFFIVSEGYGLYAQTLNNKSLNASLEVKEGKITLKNIHLSLQKGQKVTSAKAKINGSTIALKIEEKEEGINLQFSKEITVLPKRKLEIQILS